MKSIGNTQKVDWDILHHNIPVTAMRFHLIIIVTVLLLLSIAEVVPETESSGGYRCNLDLATLMNCNTDNPRIQVSKTMSDYQLRFCPSTSEACSTTNIMSLNWIECREICVACRALLGPTREKFNDADYNYCTNVVTI